jgi:rhombotail lipoprotein
MGVESVRGAPNTGARMKSLRFHPRLSGCLILLFTALLLSGGCAVFNRSSHHASSVVNYLYPAKSRPLPPTSIPVLRLPLRVGIAFVPSSTHSGYAGADGISEMKKAALLQRVADEFKGRDYIETIEILPSTYLRPGGGFDNLEQVRGLLNIDVVALVAYDQVQFTDDRLLSLAYWTIVGAYIVNGNKNDTQTLMEAAVYDISSRHLLFRAPGTSQVKGNTTVLKLDEKRREDRVKGFDAATTELIANLKTQLEGFRERVKNAPGEVQIEHKPGYRGGGAVGGVFVAALALLALLRRVWR